MWIHTDLAALISNALCPGVEIFFVLAPIYCDYKTKMKFKKKGKFMGPDVLTEVKLCFIEALPIWNWIFPWQLKYHTF